MHKSSPAYPAQCHSATSAEHVPSQAAQQQQALTTELTQFFDDFVAAFAKFDGDLIAQRYTTPYLALNADGGLLHFDNAGQIGEYFRAILARYQQQGCHACHYQQLDYVLLGREALLASVSWVLLGADGGEISHWRESYTLRRTPQGLRIFASVDHVV